MLVAGVVGMVLLALLVVLGADLDRAAQNGPGWRRRLVTAALGLLVLAGVSVPLAREALAENEDNADAAQDALDKNPAWQQLVGTWREAEEVASGARGAYPFDEAGKKRLLAGIEAAVKTIDDLAAAGALTKAEAGLLKVGLAELEDGVQAKRPTEMCEALCYAPMMVMPPAHGALARLRARVPHLEALAASGAVRPQVIARALDTLAQDVAVLLSDDEVGKLQPDAKATAVDLRERATGALRKLRSETLDGSSELPETHQWKAVMTAWKAAGPLAKSGKSTTAQRKEVDAQFAAARQAIDALVVGGLLSGAEAELLRSDADRLRGEIYANPPTDCQVTCYDMAYMPPAQMSLERLRKRLPLLENAAMKGVVSPRALALVLPSVRADLELLAAEGAEKQLGDQAEEAQRLAERVRYRIAQLAD